MTKLYYSRKFFTKKQIKKIVLTLMLSFSWHAFGPGYIVSGVKEAQAAELDDNIVVQEQAEMIEVASSITSSSTSLFIPQWINKQSSESQTKIEETNTDQEPVNKYQRIIKNTRVRRVSAYNVGDVYQNDSDPCTSANGENICLALEMGYKRCAANFVPFGTLLSIDGYGECLVVDRMNSRYDDEVDIAMKVSEKDQALKWGRRSLKVTIIELKDLEINLALK